MLRRIRDRLGLNFLLLDLKPTPVCLLVNIALLKLLNQIEDSFNLMLIYLFECLPHVSLHRFELGKLENEFGKA